METSYKFRADILHSHIRMWQQKQKQGRYPHSERELARQAGVTHTTLQNFRKGKDARGAKVTRMNYQTGLALSMTLNIPLEILLPEVLDDRTNTRRVA